jgi:glycyl-tRNA synthetase (class II)
VETVKDEERTVLKLDKDVAPYRYAVLPLMKKQPLVDFANDVFDKLILKAPTDFSTQGSIGINTNLFIDSMHSRKTDISIHVYLCILHHR